MTATSGFLPDVQSDSFLFEQTDAAHKPGGMKI